MTREDIKKEALDFSKRKYGEEYQYPMAKTQACCWGFVNGAEWRINSAWHSTDELPKRSGFLAVLMDNGIMETMYYSVGIGSHEMTLKGYTSWAYVYDLLPERKEEAK